MKPETKLMIITVAVCLLFSFVLLPKLESDQRDKFNRTFELLKQSNEMIFQYTNMTKEDQKTYGLNSCTFVFETYSKQSRILCRAYYENK